MFRVVTIVVSFSSEPTMVMLLSFLIYFLILICIGWYAYSSTESESGYALGGRDVNYFVTAIATQASDMGSWLFLAFPAAVYTRGMPEAWTAIGLVGFMFLNWHFIAARLRRATADYDSLTLSSYFHSRYTDQSGALRIVSALLTILFFTFYISSGLVGLGRLFHAAFGIDYNLGIIVALFTVVVYTLIGGFITVAWCDLFQGIFLLCAIILVPAVALWQQPLTDVIVATARQQNIPLSLWPSAQSFFANIGLVCGWGLGYFGQPHILVNFMAIDDPKKIRYAKYVGLTWQIIVLCAAIAIGLIAIGYFSTTGINNSELIFVVMAKQLLPPLIAGFALCGIFAATLSTMDHHILIAGSVFAEDIYRSYTQSLSATDAVRISRIASVVVGLSALAISYNNSNSVYDLVNYAWSGLGCSFGPLLLASLYCSWVTREGALAGMLIGGMTAGLWPFFNQTVMPMIPGFFASAAALRVVSWMTAKKRLPL